MAIYNNSFDSYQIFYYGGTAQPVFQAVIQCFQADTLVGRMGFVKTGVAVPANDTINPFGTEIPSIYFPLASFDEIFEMLRHTKPLYLYLDTTPPKPNGLLATAVSIPVGEEEGK